MEKVCVFLADGFEEIEALTPADVLRRAGITVRLVSVTGKITVQGSHGFAVTADVLFEDEDFSDCGMLFLPGGMPGTKNLEAHAGLISLLKDFYAKDRYIAAICAAPSILGHLGFLHGREAASNPFFEGELTGATVLQKPAVVSGHIITSRGMGTAIDLALTMLAVFRGEDAVNDMKKKLVCMW